MSDVLFSQPFPIRGQVALVTGANRGLGRHFAEQLLQRGASRVYGAARRPEAVQTPGVEPLRLDITDPAAVDAARDRARDVTLIVNNAGISNWTELVSADLSDIRAELETNLWGTLRVIRCFAPVLQRNGGGAILNVLSAQSWFAYPGTNGYHVAKAAEWALTNAVRLELAGQHTLVTGLHLGTVDTDFTASYDGPKGRPADAVRAALDGVERGALEVIADEWSAQIKKSLAADPTDIYDHVL